MRVDEGFAPERAQDEKGAATAAPAAAERAVLSQFGTTAFGFGGYAEFF